jgi:hypothetical protein
MNMDWVLNRIPALLVVQCNESRIMNQEYVMLLTIGMDTM